MAPPTPDRTRRLGPARRVPESALWIARAPATVGWRPDSDSERVTVRGWTEFNVAAEAAARAQDPRESRLGRRRAVCPVPVIYCPGAKGPRRGPRSIVTVHSLLQVTGLELAARTVHRRARGRSPSYSSVFLSCGSRKRDTGGRLGPGSGRLVGHPISS